MVTSIDIGTYSGGSISWVSHNDYTGFDSLSITDGLGAMEDTMTFPGIYPNNYVATGWHAESIGERRG